jgi:AcrR family transcriptional regulator
MAPKKAEITRKEVIFNTALTCFNNKGFYKTSIDDIAQKARITKGGIYYYFTSKEKLYIELFHHIVNKYFERIKIQAQNQKDPLTQLRALLERAGEEFKRA